MSVEASEQCFPPLLRRWVAQLSSSQDGSVVGNDLQLQTVCLVFTLPVRINVKGEGEERLGSSHGTNGLVSHWLAGGAQ